MKLHASKKKRKIVILCVVATILIIAAAVGAVLVINQNSYTEPNGTDITKIMIATNPSKTIYYVGESFDPSGTSIQVLTYNMDYTRFVDHTKLSFSGFDSSEVNDNVTITVSYKGFSTSFNVKVVPEPDPTPHIANIEIVGFKTEYTLQEWLDGVRVLGSKLKLNYDDGSVVEKNIQYSMIYGYTQEVSAPCTVEITIKYNDEGDLHELPVTITITE